MRPSCARYGCFRPFYCHWCYAFFYGPPTPPPPVGSYNNKCSAGGIRGYQYNKPHDVALAYTLWYRVRGRRPIVIMRDRTQHADVREENLCHPLVRVNLDRNLIANKSISKSTQGGNKVRCQLNVYKNNNDRANKLGTTLLGIKILFNTYSVIRYFLRGTVR